MKRYIEIVMIVLFTGVSTICFADCNCDDWVNRDGYCVDYVKSKIPTFPIPNSDAEIAVLKNKEIPKVKEGDVAIFDLGNYWHVAYVEKVHLDQRGKATAIDLSEMNYGGQLSFDEYKYKWRSKNEREWKRALCCGVTDKYDETSLRKDVALNTVTQIWSPATAASEGVGGGRVNNIINRVKEVINRFFDFTGRVL